VPGISERQCHYSGSMLISTGYKTQNSSTKKQINLIVQNKKNQKNYFFATLKINRNFEKS